MAGSPGIISTLSHYGAAHEAPSVEQHKQLVKHSRRLVSQTFFGTMLKQMRNSPFKSKIFDGGRGGEAFSTLMDQHLADHMANAHAGRAMAENIANKIEAKMRQKQNIKSPPAKAPPKSAAENRWLKSGNFAQPPGAGSAHVATDIRA